MTPEGLTRKYFSRLDSIVSRRRALLGFAALCAARRGRGEQQEQSNDLRNLRILDRTESGRRYTLVLPRYLNPTQRLPLLVLLHGLGETGNERLGAYAWIERYGLGSAWQRLKRPPLVDTSQRGEWTADRLSEVNAELAARPFRGFVMACPHMPNPSGPGDLAAFAAWIEQSLLPQARREAPTFEDAARTFLCGVSLGGHVSLEMLDRLPRAFGAWCGVQTAIGAWAADRYAERLAKLQPSAKYILTSTQDHWRPSSEALDAAFRSRKIPHEFRVLPGPHDQQWLREVGTLEALLWFDRLSYAQDGSIR